MNYRDDRQDEMYCPICGAYDPKIIHQQHRCGEIPPPEQIEAGEPEVGYFDKDDEDWGKALDKRLVDGSELHSGADDE